MPLVLHRFAVRLYNFVSILCVKEENQVFKVSNFSAICNILKVPFVLIYTVFVFAFFNEEMTPERFEYFKNFSTFSKVSLFFVAMSIFLISFLIAILQVTRRHEMKDFVNFWMKKSLEQEYFRQYRKTCIKYHVSGLVVFTLFVVPQFFTTTKISLLSMLSNFVFMYPYYMVLGAISFVISFQNFIIESLKEFKQDWDSFSSLHEVTLETYLNASMKYQEIYDFVQQFKRCFGLQLTLITCHMTMVLICTVNNPIHILKPKF